MTREEQFALGITLGHEAYRDGITGGAQIQFNETAEAVLGHTALAKRIQSDSMYNDMMTGLINADMNLKNDMTIFDYAVATGDWGAFGNYVGNNYDYSADYWRVTVNKDKYVTNVQEDGDSSIITYVPYRPDHFVTGSIYSSVIYNPANTIGKHRDEVPVYVYKK